MTFIDKQNLNWYTNNTSAVWVIVETLSPRCVYYVILVNVLLNSYRIWLHFSYDYMTRTLKSMVYIINRIKQS